MFTESLFSSSLLDVPRPFIDAVSSSTEALGVAGLVIERPRQDSTIVLVLDNMYRGLHLNRFPALSRATFHEIISDCSQLDNPHSIVILSSRTHLHSSLDDKLLLDLGRTMLHNAGIELVEWIVTKPGRIYCPIA